MIEEEKVLSITENLEERLSVTSDVLTDIKANGGSPIHSTILINQHAIMRAQHFHISMMLDLGISVDKLAGSTTALAEAIRGITNLP